MNYHLCRNGQNVGVFPIEELRRRRAAGELTGQDLVWCEGMANWQSLDSVLQGSGAATGASGPVVDISAKPKRSWLLLWIIGGAALLLLLVLGLIGVAAVRFAQMFSLAKQAAAQPARRADAVEVASKEVAAGTNSQTEAMVRRRGRDFRVRQYVEGYKKNGRRDQPCDAEAIKFLDVWIAANFGDVDTNLPAPQVLADKLVAQSGCDDPLIMTAAGAVCNEMMEKKRRFEKAVAGFPSSLHQAYPQFYANVVLAGEEERNSKKVAELDAQALKLLKKSFADGSFQPSDGPEIAEILVNGWGNGFFHRQAAAIVQMAQQTKGFEWLALVLDGQNQITEAWKSRGSGWADSVTPEGWKGFSDHLAKARTALTSAWNLDPNRPMAPTAMITVAMAEDGATDMRTWFDRAIAAQIDYPQAWSTMKYGLRPRWNGSKEAMLALGVTAVDTKRFDTDVPRKFFDVVTDVESESEVASGEHIYGRDEIWPYMQKMYEGYLAEPSEAPNRAGWHSAYAVVAYFAGKMDVARAQLEAVNWKPRAQNLTAWGTDLSLMPLKVAALTGNSATRVARAETSANQMDFNDAIKTYAELSGSTNTDERTRAFSVSRLAALRQQQALAKGDWVDFLPLGDDDPNWAMEGTQIKRLDDGAVEVSTKAPDGHGFYSRTHVGPEFEVTGEFEVVTNSNDSFQAGLMIGLPDSHSSNWYAYRLKRNLSEGQGISFSRGWTKNQIWKPVTLDDKHNTFQFRLQGGKADAWVNGNQVLRGAVISKEMRLGPDSMIGLGAYHDSNETVIRYRHVKVRRLVPGR